MKSRKAFFSISIIFIVQLTIFPPLFAAAFNASGNIIAGITPVEQITEEEKGNKAKRTEYNESKQFGGAYLKGEGSLSSEKLTVSGKIYYRLNSSSSRDEEAQKLDIKRAFLRYRPFGSELLEVSAGKAYSYYLSGNYFQLAEIYTGATRWGKTGIGAKSEWNGFTFGLSLPVTESYVKFKDYFGFGAGAGYDFSALSENIPVKLGASLLYTRTGADYSSKDDITDGADYDFSESFSLYFTPELEGFISKPALTLTYSHNSAPFVSNAAYKNVANYSDSDLKKSKFVSLNWRSYFGPVQFLAEGEAGHSVSGDMIPLYAGTQLLIPVIGKTVWFKPRFFYYAALDTKNDKNSRASFEFYPRVWITKGKYTFSAGADILHKEYEKDVWKWEWSVPVYLQYKI